MTHNDNTAAIIDTSIEIHRKLGPGLLESVYRKILAYELRKRGFEVIEEMPIPLTGTKFTSTLDFART